VLISKKHLDLGLILSTTHCRRRREEGRLHVFVPFFALKAKFQVLKFEFCQIKFG